MNKGTVEETPSLTRLEEEVKELREVVISDLLPKVTRLYQSRPLLLYSLHTPNLRLKQPLALVLEYDGTHYIASCYDLDVFGYGETESDAMEDLRQTIADLYYELQENKEQLGSLPQKVWYYLSQVMEECDGKGQ